MQIKSVNYLCIYFPSAYISGDVLAEFRVAAKRLYRRVQHIWHRLGRMRARGEWSVVVGHYQHRKRRFSFRKMRIQTCDYLLVYQLDAVGRRHKTRNRQL